MATTHWGTNKGAYLLATGQVHGATDLYLGLLAGASVPAAIDTAAEWRDFNTVADLLGQTGVDEPVGVWYSRQVLGTVSSTEDDTNDRVNMDVGDELFSGATAGESICGFFVAKEVGADSADLVVSGGTIDPPLPTNGSDIAAVIADLIRVIHA